MATLTLHVPDELLQQIEESARESGRSLEEEAGIWLQAGGDPELALMEQIRRERELLRKRGFYLRQEDLDCWRQEGRE